MAQQTREYKWAGHSDSRLYNSVPSIQSFGFPEIVNGPNNIVITYDDDESNGGSNVNDLDSAMSLEGWEPA